LTRQTARARRYDRQRHLGGSPHARHEAAEVRIAARRRGCGVAACGTVLAAQRLELLRELAPAARRIAMLLNPANPANAEATLKEVAAATEATGLQIEMLNASGSAEIDAAFARLTRGRFDALYVGSGPPFSEVSNWPCKRRAAPCPQSTQRAT
jgi:hypothetical protein